MNSDCLFSLFIISSTVSACSWLVVDWIQSQGNNTSPAQNVLRLLAHITHVIFLAAAIYIVAFAISEMLFFALLTATFIGAPIIALSRPAQWILELLVRIGKNIDLNCIYRKFRTLSISDVYLVASLVMFMISMLYDRIYFGALNIHTKGFPFSDVYTFLDWIPYIVLYSAIFVIVSAIGAQRIKKISSRKTIEKIPSKKIIIVLVTLNPWLIIAHHHFVNFQTFYYHLNSDDIDLFIPVIGLFMTVYLALFSATIESHRPTGPSSNTGTSWFKFLCWAQSPFLIGFILWLFLLVPRYSEVSTDCSIQRQHSFTLDDGSQVTGVLARRFETYFLIRNCQNNELKFVKADWNL